MKYIFIFLDRILGSVCAIIGSFLILLLIGCLIVLNVIWDFTINKEMIEEIEDFKDLFIDAIRFKKSFIKIILQTNPYIE